jgi:hypothetical protein
MATSSISANDDAARHDHDSRERAVDTARAGPPAAIRDGADVEVFSRFDGSWLSGFQLTREPDGAGAADVSVRRTSDGTVLGGTFPAGEVRPASRSADRIG